MISLQKRAENLLVCITHTKRFRAIQIIWVIPFAKARCFLVSELYILQIHKHIAKIKMMMAIETIINLSQNTRSQLAFRIIPIPHVRNHSHGRIPRRRGFKKDTIGPSIILLKTTGHNHS